MNNRIKLFGIDIDRLDMSGAIDVVESWVRDGAAECRYVVTPNVDHVVKLSQSAPFQDAYRHAALVVADGKPVVLAARLLGTPLPGTVTGSDLVPAIFERYQRSGESLRVFLLGAAPGVGERAKRVIEGTWPRVQVVGVLSPPLGFEHDEAECERICSAVSAASPDLLVLGLGAPKQELWVRRFHKRLPVHAALCVGATIDFLAGEKARAPKILQALGLEWAHRMFSEPRRLVKRYAYDAWVYPRLFLREWLSRR